MFRLCVLEERFCNNCGECDYCDLDPKKLCDNCCKCLDLADYNGIKIDKIILDSNELENQIDSNDKS